MIRSDSDCHGLQLQDVMRIYDIIFTQKTSKGLKVNFWLL